jgi:hypothetical protein
VARGRWKYFVIRWIGSGRRSHKGLAKGMPRRLAGPQQPHLNRSGNFLIDKIMRLLRYVVSCNRQQPSTGHRNFACFNCCGGLIWLPSGPIAGLPDEKNESRDHANHDKHPVLTFETQKGKMPNEKLHRSRSLFVQDRRFSRKNILFIYFLIPRTAHA